MLNHQLRKILKNQILLFDGAMGTQLQVLNLNAENFGGEKYNGCNEALNLYSADKIQKIHEAYFEAGADVVETNTFGGHPIVLSEYKLENKTYEINKKAAEIAKYSAGKFANTKFVAGSIGPTTKYLSLLPSLKPDDFDNLSRGYETQIKGLIDGGIDILLFETFGDTLNLKAGLVAAQNVQNELKTNLPVMISITIEASGTMLAGQNIEALLASVEHFKPFSVGLNCAIGPDLMTFHLRTLAKISPFFINVMPNAGMPDQDGNFPEGSKEFAKKIKNFVNEGLVNIVGGCCGTTAQHIRKIRNLIEKKPNCRLQKSFRNKFWLSGIDFLEYTEDMKPLLVGERSNSIGCKKFRNLIAEEKYDLAAEIGAVQAKKGAHIIDLCLANPDRDENIDFQNTVQELLKKTRLPIMIDSTNPEVIENALKMIQGKSVINSINFEDGKEKFERVANLAKKYGAALVVGTIDEKGMGKTKQRKLEITTRAYKYLVEKLNYPEVDIIFDPLVFPLGTGKEELKTAGIETIDALKKIKKKYPNVQTILGISNCSFGLPPAGREILNSVYLYEAVKNGLDIAIVNTEKLARYSQISNKEKKLAENLLFNKKENALEDFANFYRNNINLTNANQAIHLAKRLTPKEQIRLNIIEGTKGGLIEALDSLRKNQKSLEIINKILLPAMSEVGKLFGSGQLIVAEVLQSAESMKTAVDHLEQFMDQGDVQNKKKFLLATVKGDVHDIGKNLVEIIFENNGFEVINLGTKVPANEIVNACKKHNPDLIGLSGLLVKSCEQMVEAAKELKRNDINTPLILGGAALTKKFVEEKVEPEHDGKVIYAADAMSGLEEARRLFE